MEPGLVVPFGRYVLQERLAQGGMGEVFRAVAVGEHGFEKPVVVKRILPAHAGREDLTDLFVAEAKLMTRLAHPNIVEVLDFGRGEHRDYYLVLELVEGVDLGRLMRAVAARGEGFSIPLALFVASQVLRGLHHAHTRSAGEGGVVVHRDVSPSNVLCSTEGEVKVADFGVALVTRAGERGEGAGVAGKPGYMAPEQFDGGTVDPRADVFSAGVVLHQMLTGELPFRGDTPEAVQEAARRGVREPARDRRPEVSAAVEEILARAMAPRAEDRFPDARAMAQAIEALRDQGQRIAVGDDLAEAVSVARRELPATGRKVIALTGASGVAVEEEGPRELTRSGAPGAVGAFTLRFPVRADATTRQRDAEGTPVVDRWSAPEPRTEKISPPAAESPLPLHGALLPVTVEGPAGLLPGAPEPGTPTGAAAPGDGPRRRTARSAALAALLAAAVLGVAALALHGSRPVGTGSPVAAASSSTGPISPPPALDAVPSPSTQPVAMGAAPGLAAQPIPATAAITTAAAPRTSGHPLTPRLSTTATSGPEAPRGSVQPSATAPPPDDCAGDVAFYSEGAWVITGGPRTVQSPSPRESWRCGTYQLVARSRLDPSQVKSATVTVSANRQSRVDLR